MSYNFDQADTRKQKARFSVNEWLEFRERLTKLKRQNEQNKNSVKKSDKYICERDIKILEELIVNMKSTAELAYLGRNNESYSWLKSNQNKPISVRRIQQILTTYYPEFHIQKTHKQERPERLIRTEQKRIKAHLIKERGFCGWCGSTEHLDLHHMIPIFLGGTNDDCNLIFMCEKCHQIHTNYVKKLYEYGGGKKANIQELI